MSAAAIQVPAIQSCEVTAAAVADATLAIVSVRVLRRRSSSRSTERVAGGRSHPSRARVASRVAARWPTRGHTRPTWWWSAPGWPAWPRPAQLSARGASVVVRRGARPRRRPRPEPRHRRRQGRRGRRAVDRPDPGPARRARRGARASRPSPPTARAQRDRVRRQRCAATRARSRASTRLVLLDVERAQRRLNRLARSVPLHAPWEAPNAAKLDGQTAATWMRRNLATKPGRMLLELGIEAVWAAQPEDMSLLHVLFYIHSAGSLEMLFDTEGGAQQDRFVGGSQLHPAPDGRGARRRADRARRARCGASSTAPDGVTVHADGHVARGRRAILAIAPTLAGRIAYDPPLPGYRDQLTQRMPLGTVAKCMAIYDEPFWRAEGLSGQGTSDRGPVRLTFDNSPPDGSPGRAARLPRGPPRARARPPAGRGAPHRGDRLLHAPVRRRARPGRTPTSSGSGPRRSGRAAATAATCPPAPGRTTARRCTRRSARCTGPAPSTRRSGTATWTARCARARLRPRGG